MERGDVYRLEIPLPNRDDPAGPYVETFKWVLVLRGGAGTLTEPDVPVIVCSTDKRPDKSRLRPYEVLVGTAEGFRNDTIIDCRWPYTVPKERMDVISPTLRLDAATMKDVSVALFMGLQMRPPAPPPSKPTP